MATTKTDSVFLNKKNSEVRIISVNTRSRLVENKKEALYHADILALNEKRSVQPGIIEIEHPIINNLLPLIETRMKV